MANTKQKTNFVLILLVLAIFFNLLINNYNAYAFTGTSLNFNTTNNLKEIATNPNNNNYDTTLYSNKLVGNYSGLYNGYFGFLNQTQQTQPILISLIYPLNKSGTYNESISFKFTISQSAQYCQLLINNSVNQTIYNPSGLTTINTFLNIGKYRWQIKCYNFESQEFDSQIRTLTILRADGFSGTNLTNVDISNITNLTLKKQRGQILFNGTTDLSKGENLKENILITENSIFVNSSALPELNKSAIITFYNTNLQYPIILRDNQFCNDCSILENNQNITFSVPHFTTYSVSENSKLIISDTTDSEQKYANDLITLYANYTNLTSREPINAYCNITFEDTGTFTMNFDGNLYNYQRTFATEGIFYYNISCDGSLLNYAKLSAKDYVSISKRDGPQGANLTNLGSERGNSTSVGVEIAQQGNITPINLESKIITNAWQGYYGNISGQIILESPDNKRFYDWQINEPKGQVYATRAQDVNFATINCTSELQIQQEELFLGKQSTDSDSVNNTFNQTLHPSISVGSIIIPQNTCRSTNMNVNGNSQNTNFYEILLSDSANNIIYTALIDSNKIGFDNNIYDFQMLVGENGQDSIETTTYYFFLELT
ncbi:MAG: hypothetical protein QXE31_02245 [Candidatus Woesearchaeota archaeon]